MARVERRTVATEGIQLRRAANGATVLEGHAAVFNKPSLVLGDFVETIAPGAFDGADLSDVRILFNHDPSQIFGRTRAGTADVTPDSTGLRFRVTLPETSQAAALAESVRRGDVSGASFAFQVAAGGDRWERGSGNDPDRRTLTDIAIVHDAGPVVFPAYPDTSVAKRAYDEWRSQGRPSGWSCRGGGCPPAARTPEDRDRALQLADARLRLGYVPRRDTTPKRPEPSALALRTPRAATCAHEAAHALLAVLLGLEVTRVEAGNRVRNFVRFRGEPEFREDLALTAAGVVGERVLLDRHRRAQDGDNDHLERAAVAAVFPGYGFTRQRVSDPRVRQLVEEAERCALEVCRHYRDTLRQLAEALEERRTLSGPQVDEIIGMGLQRRGRTLEAERERVRDYVARGPGDGLGPRAQPIRNRLGDRPGPLVGIAPPTRAPTHPGFIAA